MGKRKRALVYKRIILKLSGEAFQGKEGFGINHKAVLSIAREVGEVASLGIEVGVVVGGGNILRGKFASSGGTIDRATADYMGMLATVMNGLALQDILEKEGISTRVQTAIGMEKVTEPYIRKKAIRHLEKGRVVIFVGGTGNPYFTTDTTAALRGMEIAADVMLKATKVDGVYSRDPKKYKNAKRFKRLTFSDVLDKGIEVMDLTAITLCMEGDLPIIVFDFFKKGNTKRVVQGEKIGTRVSGS